MTVPAWAALPPEPRIVINGRELTEGQAMALRVAASSMLAEMSDHTAAAELGHIADGYRDRITEVLQMMEGIGR